MDPLEPFRPRLARVVCTVIALLIAAGTVALVAALPSLFDRQVIADQMGIGAVGVFGVWFCWRQISVAALPSEQGLVVRNLVVTRRLEWAEIVLVRFGDAPWVQLDLADGQTLAVMGIQRADGAFARGEASRLAALVEAHAGRDAA